MINRAAVLHVILLLFVCAFAACTFDYGEDEDGERTTPDLVMTNVTYVRVRSADPIARFQAERAERFEERGVMILQNFSFEQLGDRGNEVSSFGTAGFASIDINSGDVFMEDGVRMIIESEDIIMETNQLQWLDDPRILSSGPDDEVHVFRDNGTNFVGIGLRAYSRDHTWSFSGAVSGTFISEDDEDDETYPTEIGYIDEAAELDEPRDPTEIYDAAQIDDEWDIVEVDEDAK